MAKTKKYFVEQVVEDEEEVKKEQADTNEGGILKKDMAEPAVVSKVDAPASDAEPTEPLDKAKALTEEVNDNSDVLNQVMAKLEGIEARLSKLEAEESTEMEEANDEPEIDPTKPKVMEEDAVGFEGDNPSGPSYGAKSDVDGGLLNKDISQDSTNKTEEESEEAIPKEPLNNVQKLNESLLGRRVVIGSVSTLKEDGATIEQMMKEYAKNVGRY